jgi:hypothetical protein
MGSILRILILAGIIVVLDMAGMKLNDWHLWAVIVLAASYGFVFNKK